VAAAKAPAEAAEAPAEEPAIEQAPQRAEPKPRKARPSYGYSSSTHRCERKREANRASFPRPTRASARQRGLAHQELVDGMGGLTPFADRPHDEGLAAADVAGGEHLRPARDAV